MNLTPCGPRLSDTFPFGNVGPVGWSLAAFRQAARKAGLVYDEGPYAGQLMTKELGRRSGVSASQLSKIWSGEGNKRPTLRTTAKIAKGLGEYGRDLLQSADEDTGVTFKELSRMVFDTPALKLLAVIKADDLTVGDLLRYRVNPSTEGELDEEAVWKHIVSLRRGKPAAAPGRDVTEAEAARVPRLRRRRGGNS